ncbi:MAG: InlB B-repeat-containing protein [Clostridia bacterium]|nr:InlB B-repeat-containing protein [Clostridia bacterium]
MKKLILLMLLLALCITAVFSFASCNASNKEVDEMKTKLEATKDSEKESYEQTKSALEGEYASALASLNKTDADDKAALSALKSEHEKALSDINEEDARLDGEIADLKTEYASKIEAAGGDPDEVMLSGVTFLLMGNGENQTLDEILAEYREKLDKLEDDKKNNKEKKEKLVKEYNEKLTELEKKIEKNAEDIEKCIQSFEKRLLDIETEHNAKLAEIDKLIAELSDELSEVKDKLEKIESKFENISPAVKEYEISFKSGSNDSYDSVTVAHGNKIATPKTTPSRAGYVFLGWYYLDIEWSFIGYSVTEDMELVAKWQPVEYTLELENYEADGSAKTETFTVESDEIVVTAPKRDGYTFDGWTSESVSTPFKELKISKGSVGNVSYTANWTPITYGVILEDNNADGSSKTVKYTIESDEIIVEAPERLGYTFAGWMNEGNDTLISEIRIAKGSLGNKTYTAIWKPIIYTITLYNYYDNGSSKIINYSIESDPITISGIYHAGKEFRGWKNGDSLENLIYIPKGSYGNKAYTADFSYIEYTIEYVVGEGTNASGNPLSYNIASPKTELIAATPPAGKVFDGWYDEYGKYVTHISGTSTGKITLYARYSSSTIGYIPQNPLGEEWWKDLTYDTTDLLFQMTLCSNNQELSSGCERYLAGKYDNSEAIDTLIAQRNENAYINTSVEVTYLWNITDDAATYGYSKNINRIFEEVSNKTKNTPDMYCNFITDMLCTSLKGSFANIYSRQHGSGNYAGANYFDLHHDGYMSSYMASLTLDCNKIYIVASDYFIDLIRAFFIVPVNVNVYNSIAGDMVEDYNEDGMKNIEDFFYEVQDLKWNYDRVAQYAAKAYKTGMSNCSGDEQINDQLGFVLAQNGLPAAAMVYSSSVSIVTKPAGSDASGYSYPAENPELDALTKKLSWLFDQTGVMCVTSSDARSIEEKTPLLGVRKQFTSGKILFGGVIILGNLEYEAYQEMKKGNKGGFGVVPVPAYKQGDEYRTQIHVVGRAGGIAFCTSKFVQCSAFLQYQTEHSKEIVDHYYNYNLTYDTASGLDGNIEMVEYIRSNLGSGFDKLFEDAIGFYYEDTQPGAEQNRWHTLIVTAKFQMDNMSDIYKSLIGAKQTNLDKLKKQYEILPS